MASSQNLRDDVLKILVATDIHLGFKHQDPLRGNDSINTFEEILQLARQNDVDFVLLGGDLFHENKPPRAVMHGCLELLRKYCIGDTPQRFQILNTENPDSVLPVNKEMQNLNISMPVLSIHGNHDEPTGPQHLSAVDIIQSSGLIRYFGKTSSVEEIQVKPLLLQKGSAKLALYGIGFIRSDKLHQMYRNKKVTLMRPTVDKEDWFNVFILHQNRVKRPDKTHVEEKSIDDFIDLVIWGHEHQSIIKPERSAEGSFCVTQPGSTIATEFKDSEKAQKHVGLLTVRARKHFELRPIPLQTVRQLYIQSHVPRIELTESPEDDIVIQRLLEDCKKKVEDLLIVADNSRGQRQPKEPLIRIKIRDDHNLTKAFSIYRFGLQFVERVANPETIVAFGRKTGDSENSLSDWLYPQNPDSSTISLENILRDELQKQPEQPKIVQEADLLEAIKTSVNYDDRTAVPKVLERHLQAVQDRLKKDAQLCNQLDTPIERCSTTDAEMEAALKYCYIDGKIQAYRAETETSARDNNPASHTNMSATVSSGENSSTRSAPSDSRDQEPSTSTSDLTLSDDFDRPTPVASGRAISTSTSGFAMSGQIRPQLSTAGRSMSSPILPSSRPNLVKSSSGHFSSSSRSSSDQLISSSSNPNIPGPSHPQPSLSDQSGHSSAKPSLQSARVLPSKRSRQPDSETETGDHRTDVRKKPKKEKEEEKKFISRHSTSPHPATSTHRNIWGSHHSNVPSTASLHIRGGSSPSQLHGSNSNTDMQTNDSEDDDVYIKLPGDNDWSPAS